MKNLYLILLLIVASSVGAQTIVFADANFKAKLLTSSPATTVARNLSGSYFKIDSNNDGQIQVSEALQVTELRVPDGNIINLAGLNNFSQLRLLDISANDIATADLSSLQLLTVLYCIENPITSLDVTANLSLEKLYCAYNELVSLNVSNLLQLEVLECQYNNLTSLVLSSNSLLELNCSGNEFTALDLSQLPALTKLVCQDTDITTLDCQFNTSLTYLSLYGNQLLETLFLKNGSDESLNIDPGSWGENWVSSNNLQYICVDEDEIVPLQTLLNSMSDFVQPILINSYCSFVPGGNYNTFSGMVRFDADSNGCDINDAVFDNIKIGLSDGTNSYAGFTKADGTYKFYVETGSFTVAPTFENAAFFNISPPSVTHTFTGLGNDDIDQNFCVTANGIHPDLEIVVMPLTNANPGFVATYKIVYRNVGNQMLSQQYGINLFFNHNLQQINSATPFPESTNPGAMSWSYANLRPFETRSIEVSFTINPPTADNPVNIGDVLSYTASILPMANDESTGNNTFVLNQTVIGSFDPNDIICLQGAVVPPSEIGDYLHYVVNFENTGTAPAQNIVVKVVIDPLQYNIPSLQLMDSSHDVNAKVTGNIAEFIFENIQLDSGGHGNILLKIRSGGNLTVGDVVFKKAAIFFDYNFPVITNDAETTFATLSTPEVNTDSSVKVYPNPAFDVVNISANKDVLSVQLYDIGGRLLVSNIGHVSTLDISGYGSGVYFIKIRTSEGESVQKLIKR